MENYEEQQSHLKDQLCHIFSYGVSTLCLVCKRIVSGSTSPSNRQKRILNHLDSSGHVESMRNLFKLCIPDPVCDADDGTYLDIVSKSIFDISVLLGEGSSYICQKEKNLVCLMCRSFVSEITSSFAQIIFRITQHLESAIHANSIKEICWFYRINTKNDYLLFHKSIFHCSLCQETVECKENKLLQTAVSHLESNSHEVRLHFKLLNVEKEESAKHGLKCCDNLGILEQKDEFIKKKSKVEIEVINDSVERSKESNVHLHSRGVMDTTEIINNENKDEPLPKKHMGSFSSSVSDEQSSHYYQHCPSGIGLVEKYMKDTCPFILSNRQFLSIKADKMFCTICCKSVGVISDKRYKFEKCLLGHIGGKEHIKSLNTRRHKNEEIQTVRELFVESDIEYFKVLFSNVKNTSYFKEFLSPALYPVSIKTQIQNSNLQQQTFNVNSSRFDKADVVCHHRPRSEQKKVFEKCRVCLQHLLKSKCPSKYKGVIQLKVINNKCICGVCKHHLSSTSLHSLVASYFTHCESKAHKRRLDTFLIKKRILKEKRQRRKEKKKLRKIKKKKKEEEKTVHP